MKTFNLQVSIPRRVGARRRGLVVSLGFQLFLDVLLVSRRELRRPTEETTNFELDLSRRRGT